MIRIGIISPSEIAFRRFLPALSKVQDFTFVGVAVANNQEWCGVNESILRKEYEKAEKFILQYGGKIFTSYQEMIEMDDIDALYVPLPPALHYQWAMKGLLANKHVLVEKPATTLLSETKALISLAKKKHLALHENYMFAFHDQIKVIDEIIADKEIGDVRLYRISFGFPQRAMNDFRYNKKLGGGALLDCGGYTIKYASMLLGDSAKIIYAKTNAISKYEVDMYGSAALINDEGVTAQIAFGMDNSYKCDLEVWGSKGSLKSGRVLTAPADYEPELTIQAGNETVARKLPADDTFLKSIQRFNNAIKDNKARNDNYTQIQRQAQLVNEFIRMDQKVW